MFFEGRVYFIEMLDSFHLIDYNADPTQGQWVVVERLSIDEVILEQYHGQYCIGVVRFLRPYQWVSQRAATLSVLPS